jgi:hypothetical protein
MDEMGGQGWNVAESTSTIKSLDLDTACLNSKLVAQNLELNQGP